MSDNHNVIAQLQKDVEFLKDSLKVLQDEMDYVYKWTAAIDDEIERLDP